MPQMKDEERVPEVEAPVNPVACPTCGSPLVNIITGAVCPKGCGKVWPRLSAEENAKSRKLLRVAELPRAVQHPTLVFRNRGDFADCGLYRLKDQQEQVDLDEPRPGLYRRVARKSACLVAHDGHLLARYKDQVIELTIVGI